MQVSYQMMHVYVSVACFRPQDTAAAAAVEFAVRFVPHDAVSITEMTASRPTGS